MAFTLVVNVTFNVAIAAKLYDWRIKMSKTKAQFRKTENGMIRLDTLMGVVKSTDHLFGFDKGGFMPVYLGEDTPENEINELFQLIKQALKNRRDILNTPCGGGLSIELISEVYVNPNSGNLIISSIAPDKALLILKEDEYSDMDALADEVQDAIIALSNGENKKIDWQAYTA